MGEKVKNKLTSMKSKVLKMNHLMGHRAPILIALKTFTHLIRAAWQKVRQQDP